MYDNASPGKESRGYDQQPARIVLQNGETFDVIHHDRTADNRWVFAYVDSREDGIDYRFPSSSVAYIDTTSDEYERVEDLSDAPSTVITAGASPPEFEDDDSDDEDCELVTDGGRRVDDVVQQLIDQSSDVEREDVTVNGTRVAVSVIDRTVTFDAKHGRVSDVVRDAVYEVGRARWRQYPDEDEEGGDEQ